MAIRFQRRLGKTEVQVTGKHQLILIEFLNSGLAGRSASYKSIAAAIGTTEGRVSTLMEDMRQAFRLSNRWELLLWALQHATELRLGLWMDPDFHQPGCLCSSPYCASQAASLSAMSVPCPPAAPSSLRSLIPVTA